MDTRRANGAGCLSIGALINAAGAIPGRRQGIVSVGVASNVYTVALDPQAGFFRPTWNVRATVQGAVAGVAIPFFPTPTTMSVATFNGAGAAAPLPFYLSARPRRAGRFVRGPVGNLVGAGLVVVTGGVPAFSGPGTGFFQAIADAGTGVYGLAFATPPPNSVPTGIDPLNAVIHVTPAETGVTPVDSAFTVQHNSDASIVVNAFDAGTPADRNFYITVERIDVG